MRAGNSTRLSQVVKSRRNPACSGALIHSTQAVHHAAQIFGSSALLQLEQCRRQVPRRRQRRRRKPPFIDHQVTQLRPVAFEPESFTNYA